VRERIAGVKRDFQLFSYNGWSLFFSDWQNRIRNVHEIRLSRDGKLPLWKRGLGDLKNQSCSIYFVHVPKLSFLMFERPMSEGVLFLMISKPLRRG
jgi:hypothetical protein